MEGVIRALAIYLFLMVIFRISGKRSIANITTFDFVLLLIIAEATQQALLGQEDFSLMKAFVLTATLVGIDIGLSLLKQRFESLQKVFEGLPVLVVRDGEPLKERMNNERLSESEVLAHARTLQGLERMEQIKYAVLETNGQISIIPKQDR
jgi:uncharacterized membrane protein YcaP (DUF421 family)